MTTDNICFCGEIRKILIPLVEKSALSGAIKLDQKQVKGIL